MKKDLINHGWKHWYLVNRIHQQSLRSGLFFHCCWYYKAFQKIKNSLFCETFKYNVCQGKERNAFTIISRCKNRKKYEWNAYLLAIEFLIKLKKIIINIHLCTWVSLDEPKNFSGPNAVTTWSTNIATWVRTTTDLWLRPPSYTEVMALYILTCSTMDKRASTQPSLGLFKKE